MCVRAIESVVLHGCERRRLGDQVTARKPRKVVKLSVAEAAATGDRRLMLEALRDKLATELEVAGSGVVAQIASQLRATVEELDGLPIVTGSVVDEIATRRKSRGTTTKPLDSSRSG